MLKKISKNYYFRYTIVFLLMAIFVYGIFIFSGRTFVDYQDGMSQHFRALMYYRKIVRDSIHTLLTEHRLSFQYWSMAIGEGDDIVATLTYYSIGDPFNFLSIFVPESLVWFYYGLASVLRVYFGGLFFSMFCFELGKNNQLSVLTGAIAYCFGFWGTYNMLGHFFFLIPLCWFPLMLLGVERIIRRNERVTLAVAVMFAGLSHYYFFEYVVILTIVYVAVRLVIEYGRDVKQIGIKVFNITWVAMLGSFMASATLVPSFMGIINSARMGTDNAVRLLYPMSFYRAIPRLIFTNNIEQWTAFAFCGVCIAAIWCLFRQKAENKEQLTLKVLWVISAIIVVFPFLGQFINGMSYSCNRWTFALCFLSCYTLVTLWDRVCAFSVKEAVGIAVFGIVCVVEILLAHEEKQLWSFTMIAIAAATMFAVSFSKGKKTAEIIFGCTLIALIVNVLFMDLPIGLNKLEHGKTISLVRDSFNANETAAVEEIGGRDSFYRYSSGAEKEWNAGFSVELPSIIHYFSTCGDNMISKYRRSIAVNEGYDYFYATYDEKAIPMSLSSVKYHAIPTGYEDYVPHGFEFVDSVFVRDSFVPECRYDIYENKNALPLAYGYDNYMTEDKWNGLNTAQRQEAMLTTAVVANPEAISSVAEGEPVLTSTDVNYEIVLPETITQSGNAFVVSEDASEIELVFEGQPKSETYFYVENLDFVPEDSLYYYKDGHNSMNISMKADTGTNGSINFITRDFRKYENKRTFMENLQYSEEPVHSITVKFPYKGTYTFDALNIYCQELSKMPEEVEKLKSVTFTEETIGINEFSGKASSKEPVLLCMSVPFSKGWSAYVDGKEVPILITNVKNMSVELSAGEHEVHFVYTPLAVIVGRIMSLAALAIFILCQYGIAQWEKKRLQLTDR